MSSPKDLKPSPGCLGPPFIDKRGCHSGTQEVERCTVRKLIACHYGTRRIKCAPYTTRKRLIHRSLPVACVLEPTLLIISSSVCYKPRYWYNLAAALVSRGHATGKLATPHPRPKNSSSVGTLTSATVKKIAVARVHQEALLLLLLCVIFYQ